MSGTLQATILKDGASSTNNLTFDSSGNVTAGANLTVTGASTMSSTLAVTGASTMSSTLAVTGAITGSSTVAAATGTLYPIVSGTAQASTSGTSITFSSIPSWVKRITVMLSGVSLSGSAHILVQIGSGSTTTSGYISSSGYCFGPNIASGVTSTSGFIIIDGTASQVVTGLLTICLLSGNTYVSGHSASIQTAGGITGSGNVTLSGVLDRIIITSTTGTDTFDAGSINILYE